MGQQYHFTGEWPHSDLLDRVRENFRRRFARVADDCREQLIALYGDEQGRQVKYAEAFEICEYGRQPSDEELRKLFPMLPEK
jgi:hypothetical protein